MLEALKRRARRVLADLRDGGVVRVRGPRGVSFNWIGSRRYPEEMRQGRYEAELVVAILDLLQPGDCFLDVGANAGYISLCAKRAVGPGSVLAFEPLPENVATLRRVQTLNPDLPLVIVEAAVAAQEGEVALEVTRNNANSRLSGIRWELSKPAVGSLRVKAVRLKPYLQEYRPAAIKLDTEGAEYTILQSLAPTADWAARPVFVVECHGKENGARCSRLLVEWGYRLFTLDGRLIAQYKEEQFILARPGP